MIAAWVKRYFYTMPNEARQRLLAEYGQRYGYLAQEYAEEALPLWRSGRRIMSGMVAQRLFSLLPARMPLAAKYELTETLWRHVGPSSRKVVRIGPDAALEDVLAVVEAHIADVVVRYQIPESMERRFSWLAGGDVRVKQDLLNHLRQLEKTLTREAVRLHFPPLAELAATAAGRNTHRVTYTVRIGKHELQLLIDLDAVGVTLEDPRLYATGTRHVDPLLWLWLLVPAAAAAAFFLLR